MPPPATRPRLRKREIALAIGAGALASVAAAGILSDGFGGPGSSFADRVEQEAPQADEATYQVAEFERIATVGAQDVEITFGDTYSVRAEGSPKALGQLEVVSENGELIIRPKRQFGGDWESLSSATFHITVPHLERIALAGSGDIRIDRIESDRFSGDIAGSGKLAIGAMKVDEAAFSIGGSGSVSAAGTARHTQISIGGQGEIDAAGLQSETAQVRIGGVGDVELTVNDEAEISIAGSGDIDITGTARCSVSRFGVGEVRCNGQVVD
jgi:hypothetical protein